MNDSARTIQDRLHELALVAPTADATVRALGQVRAVIPAPTPTPRRRWLWPASVVAAVAAIVAATLTLPPRQVSAQKALATTLQASQGFRGWIHMTSLDDKNAINDWNTETGANALRYLWGNDIITWFTSPKDAVSFEYHSATHLVMIGEISREKADRQAKSAALAPQTINDLLATLRDGLGRDVVKVTDAEDGALRRFDITITRPPPALGPEMFSGEQLDGHWFTAENRPSAIWIDPKTNLVVRATVGPRHLSFSYGEPDIHSIYDAGAPLDARVFDCRPSHEAIALYDRLQARSSTRFPEGVVAVLDTLRPDLDELTLYCRKGENWMSRHYDFNLLDPKPHELQLPDHWQDTGADELFRRIARVFPREETAGDGREAWIREFKIETGDVFVSYASSTMGPDDKGMAKVTETKNVPGELRQTGDSAKLEARLSSPTRLIYPDQSLQSRYGSGGYFEIATSPDRPGLVAVRATLFDNNPDIRRAVFEDWIDPAHNDRAVAFTQDSYTDNRVTGKTLTEFNDYETLPAPDNRSYPTTWTQTYSRLTSAGDFVVASQRSTVLHFFQNRTLPDLPKRPATTPAAVPASSPAIP